MTLTPSKDVLVAHLAGEAVLLNLDDKSYYRLNETAALVWAALERGENRDTILSSLLEKYEVSSEEAGGELDTVLADFESRGLARKRI